MPDLFDKIHYEAHVSTHAANAFNAYIDGRWQLARLYSQYVVITEAGQTLSIYSGRISAVKATPHVG